MTKYNCKVCRHEKRDKIEDKRLVGASINSLSSEYDIGWKTLDKHFRHHLPAVIAEDRKGNMPQLKPLKITLDKELPSLNNLSGCIEYVHSETLKIHKKARDNKDDNLSLRALRQDVECISLAIRTKELRFGYDRQKHWHASLARILSVLNNHPEIRDEVADILYSDLGGDKLLKEIDYQDVK